MQGLKSPCLVGIVRPAILLPRELPAEALSWALAHELTHLKHRDTWYMLLMTLARCVHWFNPLVWLMVRTARRDMELCCDYDLLNGQGEEARRAYGRAILDQMTGRDRGFSGLTTGFSGSKKEVFARFRAMMDTAPKRKGRALLALAAAAIVLSGSLVACQAETQPQTWTAWVDAMDLEERTVTYTLLVDSMGEDMERTAPLAEDAQLLHTYEGEAYPLNPETLRYTQDMAQDGLVGTVELNGRGEVVRVQLNVSSQLDLTAAGLDFAGYCGEVYAAGMGGAMLLHGVAGISVDPCDELGQDSDHTRYTLPLAEDTVAVLQQQRKKTGSSPWVFPSPTGGPISPDSVLHMLHRVLKRAGLPRVRFHDLRHTFATLALQNGVDIKTVSGMLGHFSAGFTLDTYAHVTTAAQKEAAKAMERVLTAAL